MFLYAQKILADRSGAADAVHDAFLNLLLKVRDGENIENVFAYLMMSVRNTCLNHRRDSRIQYVDMGDMEIGHEDATVERNDVARAINAAIDALPIAYKEAFLLQAVSGLSYAEICVVTGETLSVVRHRIHRAKMRLRTRLIALLELNAERKQS